MAESKQTVWTFEDLGFFLGAILPSFMVAAVASRPITKDSVRALVFQSLLYALLLSVLFVLARLRHGHPATEALGWTLQFRGAWLCLLLGPVLVVAVSALGSLLRSPLLPTPIDRLADIPFPIVILFATIAGPLFEELVFRGFLQPLLTRSWGAGVGVLVAAVVFSALHGTEYEWQWQYLLLIFLAGAAFGAARYVTGSTTAAALLHMSYNLTQLVGAVLTR
ncbi:MAG: CPBP family intramembrane glutamic endopeptidase [Acidobacteriota bacterium]